MKNLFLLLVLFVFVGLMSCVPNDDLQNKNSNKTEPTLRSSGLNSNFLHLYSFQEQDDRILFFYNGENSIEYMVGIFGDESFDNIGLNEGVMAKTIGFDSMRISATNKFSRGLTIDILGGACLTLTLESSGYTTNCGTNFHPSNGFSFSNLASYEIDINEISSLNSLIDIEQNIMSIIANSEGITLPDDVSTGGDEAPWCNGGGEGAIKCTGFMSICEVECEEGYWACCNLTCKCLKKIRWNDNGGGRW